MKVIGRKQIQKRLPLMEAVVTYLALEHFNAPEWLYGALGLFFILVLAGVFLSWRNEDVVEIDFDSNKDVKTVNSDDND